jgi:peptidyl-prolyl cis-trans isomerase D
MTMLDRMRRHKNWLKWSLILVVLAFIVFYIPDFLRDPTSDLGATETVAVVQGQEISATEFRRTYQAQLQAYRQAYGGNMSDQLLRQLGVEQQILEQMVDERAALAEADRLDIKVSDEEVRQRIMTFPALQENGRFIGEQRYRQLLASQRPPLMPAEFEDSIRRALTVDKLRATVTEWMAVGDPEVEDEYRRRNDKVKLAVVSFPVDSFKPDATVTDDEVSKHFESNQENFRVPEKRKIKYLLLDLEALRAKTVVPAADIERAYNDNFQQYSTPEQIRASHILFRTEGKDEAAVRSRAEEVLKEVRAGGDFAALAKKYSEDQASAAEGGDLDFFGRGRMVPEFDQVAFALEAGQTSDLVKTSYGFHIIKLTEKKPGTTRSLDEVRKQITDQLAAERAQTEAADLADRIDRQVNTPADLETAAKTHGLTVQESEFFARQEPILGIGVAPEVAARAFDMGDNDVSSAIRTPRGYVILTTTGRQDSYLPKVDEVKERVRDVVVEEKARVIAREKAAALAAPLKSAANFEAAAKAGGFSASTTELITRDSPIPGLGMAAEVTEAAFKLPQGGVSEPIATDLGSAIVKVIEKQEVSSSDLATNKDRFREELLADRRNRFFSAYMAKVKEKLNIQVNYEAMQRIVGRQS